MLNELGYVRVGAVVPSLKVADVKYNCQEIVKMVKESYKNNVQVLSFPELCLTGYTCQDLFFNVDLLKQVEKNISYICEDTKELDIIFIVGAPIMADNKLYNTAIVIKNGQILGIVPKKHLPNSNEFYEKRWFTPASEQSPTEITINGKQVPFGDDLLFVENNLNFTFGVEICEDLWAVKPQSDDLALNGAQIIFNLSASNDLVAKNEYRYDLVKVQSAKLLCGYVYASAGVNESTTDLVYGGDCMIFENGKCLVQNANYQFESKLIFTDVDIDYLKTERIANSTFSNTKSNRMCRKIAFNLRDFKIIHLQRQYSKMPFVPNENVEKVCNQILNMQAFALAKRLKATNTQSVVIGVSGGLDSTLALLVINKTFEILNLDKTKIIAVSMQGFGTSNKTANYAKELIECIGATYKEISIIPACKQHFKDIGLKENDFSITFENTQARERTQILMDLGNYYNAIVVGTGDMSELALGFCTYNGDHMSGYSVNAGVPKTLVKHIIKVVADSVSKLKNVLNNILNLPISPELLPLMNGEIAQKTEEVIGDYELNDFFLYHLVRRKSSVNKIIFIAKQTFNLDENFIKNRLQDFIKRFFNNQFKRSCMPDAVKVGVVSLSPRGDFRMSSDTSYNLWFDLM